MQGRDRPRTRHVKERKDYTWKGKTWKGNEGMEIDMEI
jgi:hypothetical protein